MKSMKDRDSRLYKFWLEHPAMSLQKIGNVFHIKHRQQVFVIIKREEETIKLMEEGYLEMAEENLQWAEMAFPLAREIWLKWEKERTE